VKTRKWSNFEAHYGRHLPKTAKLVFEIGVQCGGGLWELKHQYPGATVVGIDIDPACKEHESPKDRVFVEVGSQANYRWLQQVAFKYGTPDVVVDDGGHKARQMITAWEALFPGMAANGVYVVEDIDCCWMPAFSVVPGMALLWFMARCGSKYPMYVYPNIMFIERSREFPSLVVKEVEP
jgi:hypothetical protein